MVINLKKQLKVPIHIEAKKDEIAEIVFIVGDPLRAKYIAEKKLENYKLVNSVRNMFFYTGFYQKQRITIASSGMGCPSMGIYSFELFKFYKVKVMIRLGSSGSYNQNVFLCDIVNAESVYTNSTYPLVAGGLTKKQTKIIICRNSLHKILETTANEIGIRVKTGKVCCSDVFTPWYQHLPVKDKFELNSEEEKCLVAEMESAALFVNANLFNRYAGCLLTVADTIFESKFLSISEREKNLNNMIEVAFASLPKLKKLLK